MRAVLSARVASGRLGTRHERLGWAFGLVSDDPVERAAAPAQLIEVQRRTCEAQQESNELWCLASLGPEEHYKELALRQARQ